jgi:ABC-2 type transport system ATP-binding protein
VLHASGRDHAALAAAIEQAVAGKPLRAERIETSLEDVFIYLMGSVSDNYGAST